MEPATEIDFTRAKAGLSEVMTEVVHRQHPKIICRNGGRDRALLIGEEAAEQVLASFRFDPQVIVDGEEVTIRLAILGLMGGGATIEEALVDLTAELDAYADRFLDDFPFYRRTQRADHLGYLLRFKMTPTDRRAALLLEDSRS
ncbi:MAG: hypothetical protein ACREOL_03060 [Candidatus Dormibacteria bacterium]